MTIEKIALARLWPRLVVAKKTSVNKQEQVGTVGRKKEIEASK